MGAAAESLTLDKDTPAKGVESGGQQTVPASSGFDPFVQRLFSGAPSDPSASVANSLSIQRFRAPVLQRAQRLYGNRASQQIVQRAQMVQRQCACGGSCSKCQEEEQQKQIQRSSAAAAPAQFEGLPASSGERLDPATRGPMESHFGTDLEDVRVHTGHEAAKSATSIDALAYTSGRDIYFASGMYAPSSDSGRHLLAHEVAHVVQQGSGKEPSIATKSSHGAKIGAPDDPLEAEADRSADAFMSTPVTDEDERKKRESRSGMPSSTRQRSIQRQPAPGTPLPAPPIPPTAANPTRQKQPQDSVPAGVIDPYFGTGTASKPEDVASPGQVQALQIRIDVLIAMLQTSFADSSPTVVRLIFEHIRVGLINKSDVLQEGDQLELVHSAMDSLNLMQNGLPGEAPQGLEPPYAAVKKAIATAVQDLATVNQNGRLLEAQAAAEGYVDAFSQSFLKKAAEAETKLQDLREFDESNNFITGYARGGRIQLTSSQNELDAYMLNREDVKDQFKALGDLGKIADATFADRLKFLGENEGRLTSLLKRVEALSIMKVGFELGTALMGAVTGEDIINWHDISTAQRIRETLIVPLAGVLFETPKEDVLAKAYASMMVELPPKPDQGEGQKGDVEKRLDEVSKYQQNIHTFVELATIAMSMAGGMAAMEAAGGSGVTAGVAGMPQIAMGQFVRGSLAFTMGSQMVMGLISGKPMPTTAEEWEDYAKQFGTQALMDMATMGLMHSVGIGLAGRYGGAANVPVGVQLPAQFAALWAWSATESLVTQPGPITTTSAVETVVKAGTQTAIGMFAGSVGHQIGTLPKLPIPESPSADQAARQRAAMAKYDQVASHGRLLEAEIENWSEKGQLSSGLERLMRESESWYGSYRTTLQDLTEAGILDPAHASSLVAETGNRIADIRNLRDMGRLGVRETGRTTVAYRGDVRNIDSFLGRLVRQQTIASYEPFGRQGIYRVIDIQGRTTFYYPEGSTPEANRGMDLNADALAQSFPGLPTDISTKAASALVGMGPSEATNICLQLSGPAAEQVLRWLAEMGSVGKSPRFLSKDLVILCAEQPAVLDMLRAERVSDLDAWSQTDFEKTVWGRDAHGFLEFLKLVRERRGSLKVSGVSEAQTIVAEIAASSKVNEVPLIDAPSMEAVGEESKPHQRTYKDWVRERIKRGYAGDFLEAVVNGQQWILQVRDGAVLRAWTWGDGDVSSQVDVEVQLKILRDGLKAADKLADPAQRTAMIEALGATADQLAFLRSIRSNQGVGTLEIAEPIQLLERVRPPQRTIPAETLPAPETSPPPPLELVPVTTRDLMVARRSALLERAQNQGLEDPLVGSLRNWDPKKGENAPSNPTVTLDLLEKQLDAARDAALKQYRTRRFGAAEMERIKQAFGGLENFADFLVSLSGSRGITAEALRGLGYMTQAPPEGVKKPINPSAVLSMARTAAERNMVLQQFARITEAQPGGIPGGYRMLADMTTTSNNWKGGAWTLKWMADNPGKVPNIASLEVEQQNLTSPFDSAEDKIGRRYDVVLKSGNTLEFKSWTNWFPESISKQFRKDVILATRSFAFLGNMENIRWLFEGPPGMNEMTPDGPRYKPMTISDARRAIREQMRIGLENAMEEAKIPAGARPRLRELFDKVIGKTIEIHPTTK